MPSSPLIVQVSISEGRVVVMLAPGVGVLLSTEAARSVASDVAWAAELIDYLGATGLATSMPIIQGGGHP